MMLRRQRRLAQVQAACGAGHVALAQQCIQRDQEVEIDPPEIERVHGSYDGNRFPIYRALA
jgi:hypothetical protein